jgi:hypothetical protein
MFNPYGVPETHEEVVAYFETFPDKFIGECMLGIYEIRRAKGEDVMLAYENALRAGIGKPAIEAAQPRLQSDKGKDAVDLAFDQIVEDTVFGEGA